MLGLVTTKVGAPRRPGRAEAPHRRSAQYVPLEQLALSPQCGFASSAEGNEISWDNQRRKLELVVDVAREVWGER